MILTLKLVWQSFHITLQLMMLHHHNKFRYKRLCGWEDVDIDILNLPCDLDLEHSNPIFSQDTPAYDDIPSYKVWLQKDQQFRR